MQKETQTTALLKSYNPATGGLLGEVAIASPEDIKNVVALGKAAQKPWAALSMDERIEALMKAAANLSEKADEISLLLSKEMGKSLRFSLGEVTGSASSVAQIAKYAKEALTPLVYEGGNLKTIIEYNPFGVVGVITPWNYPISMAHGMIVPALLAGNAVIWKPAEDTPLVAQAYLDAFGGLLPENLLQIVQGDGVVGSELVIAEGVDLIAFTGSKPVGKSIMKAAADRLKRLIMELGGNDALIVLKDANIDGAVKFGIRNALHNAGQMCISTERIFVDSSIAEEFKAKAVAEASKHKIGPYTDSEARVGPIINDKQRNRILKQLADAKEKGATFLLGGTEHPDRYITPTLIADVTEDMLVMKEEVFGPVVCIAEFEDLEKAIEMANGTPYGLGSVVFGGDSALEVARRLEVGMLGVNTSVEGIGNAPWVGAKESGYGFHGSPDGYRQFTQARSITL